MTTFVSFNTNSIRLRLHQLEALKDSLDPDIIGIQETKVQDKDFPVDELLRLGYHATFFGQKTHYGVAILSKQPACFVQKGFVADDENSQKRFIHAQFLIKNQKIDVLNGYFPQGESCHHDIKFPAKRKFYNDFGDYIKTLQSQDSRLIVMGDMNIAPLDIDVGIGDNNAKRWLSQGICSFLPEERAWYQTFSQGLFDTYRHKSPDGTLLTWFDYRSKGFEDTPKRGLRIDHILCSQNILANLREVGVSYDIRAMQKPSDHAPIWAKFDFEN